MTRTICAFFLGGTISMTGHRDGVVARIGADDIIAAVPQLADLDVRVHAQNFRALPSAHLSFADVLELAETAASSEADAIVVVQGTDTIEETAYLLDLVWNSDAPLVVTGAIRNPSMAGADGPANLLAAVQVASADEFHGLGALVVFADQVHAARHVRKTHSTSVAAFASPNAGPIGIVVEGRPVLLTSVARRPRHAPDPARTTRVPLYLVGLDDDGVLLGGADRCDGLVVAALGAGHVPAHLADALGELAARIPVVLASRTGAGPVLTHTYGFTGSETDLLRRGLIRAGLLDPAKARMLLKVALASGYDRAQVAAAFADA